MHVAIDGPSGAGKSTVARRLARELGCVYMDTGAMYRAVGLLAHRLGVDDRDDEALGRMLEAGVEIRAALAPEGQRTLLNGEDVEDQIRTQEIGMAASNVAACPSVRRALVTMQRQAAQGCDVVMDGRDIGTNVLPRAEHKRPGGGVRPDPARGAGARRAGHEPQGVPPRARSGRGGGPHG